MAFKTVIVFFIASLNIFALAHPLTYLRDSGFQNSLVTPYYQASLTPISTTSSLGYPTYLASPYVSSSYVSPSYVSPGLVSSFSPFGYSEYSSLSNQQLNQQNSPIRVTF